MDKDFCEYYLGLDIGTNSVGWAVTDTSYNVLRFNNKSMWGVRSFDEGKTAVERRTSRANRRRLERRRWRINLLQDIFAEEVCKVDETFFQRLNDSRYYQEDKKDSSTKNIFFNDNLFKDKDYYKKYPTIYHLRKALIDGNVTDIRLLYLALHHIIKYRGHFLFSGETVNTNYTELLNNLLENIRSINHDKEYSFNNDDVIEVLMKKESKKNKENSLKKIFKFNSNDKLELLSKLLTGASTNVGKMADYEEEMDISYSSSDYDVKRLDINVLGQDICDLVDSGKMIYDAILLSSILDGSANISESKIEVYDNHKKDLKLLKKIVRQHIPSKYNEIFKAKTGLYACYVGHKNSSKRLKRDSENKDGFYNKIKKILKSVEGAEEIISKIDKETFLPLQTNSDNGVIPYQVHLKELNEIINSSKKHFSFLNDSNIEKITSTFKFRVPYYVGPLNKHSEFAWLERGEGKIYPWNFEDIVDEYESARKFIKRMTNKCTYIIGENVLPKNSLLYKEFIALNHLNNLKVNGEKLNKNEKEILIEKLFKNKNKVTVKAIKEFYKEEHGVILSSSDIEGVDSDFSSDLSSYLDFKHKVFKGDDTKLKEKKYIDAVEDIIKSITIYGGEKKLLKKEITTNYKGLFSDEEIENICKLKFTGWGSLSQKLLTETKAVYNGECLNIINIMRKTNYNLQEVLGKEFGFNDKIREINNLGRESKAITYKNYVENTYLSPSVKRAVWQTIKITEEIKKITKKEPAKIFIEMARGSDGSGRTDSRKKKLDKIFESIKDDDIKALKDELDKETDASLQSKKIYLYYLQHGKCAYTGDKIELSDLHNRNIYDIDHIISQSKIKDDSFDNIVLARKIDNARKSDELIADNVVNKMTELWSKWKDNGLMTSEKFSRLKRRNPYTDDELAGFINRQLVETRQSTKAVAEIFKEVYSNSKIVYVKSRNVSEFRRKNDFVKSRLINDHHHAKDAYLNIVVGNVWNTKFTSNVKHWYKKEKSKNFGDRPYYDLLKMYDKDLGENGSVWRAGELGTIETVRKYMQKNNILFTRYAYINKGKLFNQQLVNKNPTVPIKKGIDLKYGGYKSENPAYFSLIQCYDKKGNELRRIEKVPMHLKEKFNKNQDEFINYCKDVLQLKNPTVKIPCIKKNALIVINGFPMHLTGINEEQNLLQVGIQLCLKEEFVKHIVEIENYVAKLKNNSNYINRDNNIKLYNELIVKSRNDLYKKRPACQTETFLKGADKFANLSLQDQCKVILEMLKYFACKPDLSDLSLIGGSKYAGNVTQRKNTLINKDSVILVNQSATGLFEEVIDLLKI